MTSILIRHAADLVCEEVVGGKVEVEGESSAGGGAWLHRDVGQALKHLDVVLEDVLLVV